MTINLIENNNNNNLIIFLRELANSIEHNNISGEGLKKIGEFFMTYNFYNNNNTQTEEYTKYMALGWYMYTFLLNKN